MASKTAKGIGIATIVAAIGIAVPFVTEKEGDKLQSYQDVAGVWTVCNGETLGVDKGVTLNQQDCATLAQTRVGMFMFQIAPMIQQALPPKTLAAHTSFAYNIGVDGYKRSSALRLTNAGDVAGGCRAMAVWNKVKGQVVQGLVNRRNAEIKLCLEGLK